jgi:hypothetical protein
MINMQNDLWHTKYECKYHVVFISKYSQKIRFKKLRQYHGGKVSQSGTKEGKSDMRETVARGLCAYAGKHSSQACNEHSDRI